MSNNLHKTLKLISDMRIMPLQQAHILEYFPDEDLTFELGADIDAYKFEINDTVEDIFGKYFHVHSHVDGHQVQ